MNEHDTLSENYHKGKRRLQQLDFAYHGMKYAVKDENVKALEPWQIKPERDKQYNLLQAYEGTMYKILCDSTSEALVDTYMEIVRDHAYRECA